MWNQSVHKLHSGLHGVVNIVLVVQVQNYLSSDANKSRNLNANGRVNYYSKASQSKQMSVSNYNVRINDTYNLSEMKKIHNACTYIISV